MQRSPGQRSPANSSPSTETQYTIFMFGHFLRNSLTSLYIFVPEHETIKINKQKPVEFGKFQNEHILISFSYANDLSVGDEILIQESFDLINMSNRNMQGKQCFRVFIFVPHTQNYKHMNFIRY